MNKRGSGILLHIISLPSPYGIGDFGPQAYRFADFLSQTKQSYWQVLPLNPTDPQRDYSPYSSNSSFALNPLLISPELLAQENYIDKSESAPPSISRTDRAEYQTALTYKLSILESAFRKAYPKGLGTDFQIFCRQHRLWLDNHALYTALSLKFNGKSWSQWPESIRNRNPDALKDASSDLQELILKEKFIQFLLQHQWNKLRDYCHSHSVQIIGDLPMFVNFESSDVWANPAIFKLDEKLQPEFYAGVPPDRFSGSGQLWQNPVYNWDNLSKNGYHWWVERFKRSFELFDILRIDHFRGLVAYWEISAKNMDPSIGKWESVPGFDFFNTIFKHFYCFPVIAEDLGIITPDVRETIARLGIPGMKVLLFAFENGTRNHPYLPHMYERNCMACTGTHDTNTIRGWFENDSSADERNNLFRYLGESISSEQINWKAIQFLMMSAADMVIFPLQDVLGLGKESRMNNPGTRDNNWLWRFPQEMLTDAIRSKLGELTIIYGRD
ncbi:MAG: 4-alpha-glucanotransferase [Fibrobacter sp.]|nr:4-alpha-glucanotransferase [Fibrobacter sp.]